MNPEPRFDIFSGTFDENPMWMEAVRGIERARARMNEMARENPGKYFIFSSFSHAVLDIADTTKRLSITEIRHKAVRGAA